MDIITQIFNTYDDKNEIFDDLNFKELDISNNHIIYKIHNEYGISIDIFEKSGKLLVHIFYDSDTHNISSFYNEIDDIGLYEIILSNKIEYYIDGQYYQTNTCERIDYIKDMIEKYTNLILNDKIFPLLYDFITSDIQISFISFDEVDKIMKYRIKN